MVPYFDMEGSFQKRNVVRIRGSYSTDYYGALGCEIMYFGTYHSARPHITEISLPMTGKKTKTSPMEISLNPYRVLEPGLNNISFYYNVNVKIKCLGKIFPSAGKP
jgi:hypothetical protein